MDQEFLEQTAAIYKILANFATRATPCKTAHELSMTEIKMTTLKATSTTTVCKQCNRGRFKDSSRNHGGINVILRECAEEGSSKPYKKQKMPTAMSDADQEVDFEVDTGSADSLVKHHGAVLVVVAMDNTEEQQQQRTFLRERFLRLLTSIKDKPTTFLLHNKREVQAKFGASDVDILHLQVNDLETPLGKHKAALLRTSDVIMMDVKFKDVIPESR
ncbi:hypothetical protein CAPTEDRAFT_202716 [Capitella teleta]|uniref:Uncharacterized protein n=1 Tax=Capitella teleta TaxID=283909 RepID=R7UGY5_CAPTE|nr:hypothetical protein CAPTEDRAFT_202716 [Capitella teleta]|eukprot:ELU05470.1 hypothetical protein CAPTEDRAFT_202716 [Capitella teleta]